MIAIVEICDKCGTRYQGPALVPHARALQAAVHILEQHFPEPGVALRYCCPRCSGQPMAPLEEAMLERAAARGRGEEVPELENNNFHDVAAAIVRRMKGLRPS